MKKWIAFILCFIVAFSLGLCAERYLINRGVSVTKEAEVNTEITENETKQPPSEQTDSTAVIEQEQTDSTATVEQEKAPEKVKPKEPVAFPASKAPKCVKCGDECEEGHAYCDEHECEEWGCDMPRKKSSDYCAEHSCALCDDKREYGSVYCYDHKCRDCENVVADGSDYCFEHKCLMCDNGVGWNSEYCYRHECNSCDNGVVEGSSYCMEHKCLVCDSGRAYNSPFCYVHGD